MSTLPILSPRKKKEVVKRLLSGKEKTADIVEFVKDTYNVTISKSYVYGILSAHRKSEEEGNKEPFSEAGGRPRKLKNELAQLMKLGGFRIEDSPSVISKFCIKNSVFLAAALKSQDKGCSVSQSTLLREINRLKEMHGKEQERLSMKLSPVIQSQDESISICLEVNQVRFPP
jgi:hypothetical protein